MEKYTTGEIAKLCGVTVRTVQYYDTRGILSPSALSEGGRRLYSDADLSRMKLICFLRSVGLSIDAIGRLLSEDDPGSVISLLLAQQAQTLRNEIEEKEEALSTLEALKSGLAGMEEVSLESIGDAARIISGKKALRRTHGLMLLTGLPLSILQWAAILLWIFRGFWQLVPVWLLAAILYSIWMGRWYFKKVAYLCPKCHGVFKAEYRQGLFARHTPAARELTCPLCARRGFCIEVAGEAEQ
ncbi:MAG: MerR family transcriptional regulator [Oscillospiraceae bacterium]|nr:MerR family transcriptional regulator [Oscillospiraceae bacterium]